jgi:hypothetical protein
MGQFAGLASCQFSQFPVSGADGLSVGSDRSVESILVVKA